jgi:hypothetical protein
MAARVCRGAPVPRCYPDTGEAALARGGTRVGGHAAEAAAAHALQHGPASAAGHGAAAAAAHGTGGRAASLLDAAIARVTGSRLGRRFLTPALLSRVGRGAMVALPAIGALFVAHLAHQVQPAAGSRRTGWAGWHCTV